MENQIVCPHCKKTIANNPVIDDASKEEWEFSSGTSREDAMVEMEAISKETPARVNTF